MVSLIEIAVVSFCIGAVFPISVILQRLHDVLNPEKPSSIAIITLGGIITLIGTIVMFVYILTFFHSIDGEKIYSHHMIPTMIGMILPLAFILMYQETYALRYNRDESTIVNILSNSGDSIGSKFNTVTNAFQRVLNFSSISVLGKVFLGTGMIIKEYTTTLYSELKNISNANIDDIKEAIHEF